MVQMYWLGPLLGGVIAGFLYELGFATNASPAKAKAMFTQKDYDETQFAPEKKEYFAEQAALAVLGQWC